MADEETKIGPPEGNTNAHKHGGAGAYLAVKEGRELIGIARDAELAVYDELDAQGRYALVIRNAARLQACCDLYWNAVSKAASDGDLDALDRYVRRFGWLAGVSLRAWKQVKKERPDDGGVSIADIIDGGNNAND